MSKAKLLGLAKKESKIKNLKGKLYSKFEEQKKTNKQLLDSIELLNTQINLYFHSLEEIERRFELIESRIDPLQKFITDYNIKEDAKAEFYKYQQLQKKF